MLTIAAREKRQQSDIVSFLCDNAKNTIAQNKAEIDGQLVALEKEFANEGMMAKAIRRIVAVARVGFAERKKDPFFELGYINGIKSGRDTPDVMLGNIQSCAVLQKNVGPDDQLKRDFLLSFQPEKGADGEDVESGLRVVHSVFHYVGSHRGRGGFISTKQVQQRACPFYTCCDLPLRREEASVCCKEPLKAANWPKWDQAKGACWYATGVRITCAP